VAIKEITVKKAEGVAELIKNEIELLKKVSHENIVQLLDFQIYEDMAYMVLQYC
jgi:serine/threonine protein kinase